MTVMYFLTRRHPVAQDVANMTGLGDWFAGIRMVCVDGFHFHTIENYNENCVKWTHPKPCDGLCQRDAYQVDVVERELKPDEVAALASAKEQTHAG